MDFQDYCWRCLGYRRFLRLTAFGPGLCAECGKPLTNE